MARSLAGPHSKHYLSDNTAELRSEFDLDAWLQLMK
jgi:hypothetical protein